MASEKEAAPTRAAVRSALEPFGDDLCRGVAAVLQDPAMREIKKGCALLFKLALSLAPRACSLTLEIADGEFTPIREPTLLLDARLADHPPVTSAEGPLVAEEFRAWFADCWTRAGGAGCSYFVALEDPYGVSNWTGAWHWTAWDDVD